MVYRFSFMDLKLTVYCHYVKGFFGGFWGDPGRSF